MPEANACFPHENRPYYLVLGNLLQGPFRITTYFKALSSLVSHLDLLNTNLLYMPADTNLQFIREKICQVRSAIMYSMSNDLVKLPNNIVSAVKVDEEGQLWFVCNRPSASIAQYDPSFPARLHFYRKGTMFHMEVSGKATIVEEPGEEIPFEQYGSTPPLLIRMSINNVEYTEPHEKKKGKLELIIEKGYQWVLRTIATGHDNRSVLSKLSSMKRA